MGEAELLAARFEQNRAYLRAIAYRMLGSVSDADDAVQETWLRLSRCDGEIDNLAGWLTTVVGRVCLDMLRSRAGRREEPLDARVSELAMVGAGASNPEHDAILVDSLGVALQVVIDTLAPAERVAFVLHDMFAVPFDEIAPILDRSSAATRQLASRARRRIQTATPDPDSDLHHQRKVVGAFLAAARGGDFEALLALLDPGVELWTDDASVAAGAPQSLRGARAIASAFSGRTDGAQLALVDGRVGAAWAPTGRPRGVFAFTIVDDRITRIEMIASTGRLRDLNVALLDT